MIYAVLLTDAAGVDPALRQKNMAAHLSFLEQNADHIQTAGPLFDQSDVGSGGMWIVEAQSPEEVEALIRADPFWSTGLRESHRILRWHQVFADGKRT